MLVSRLILITFALATSCAPRAPGLSVMPQPPHLPCATQGCSRLLSWNVHGLPFLHAPTRLTAIADLIRSEAPDIVALQEVWLASYQRQLIAALRFGYDPVFEPRGHIVVGPEGGLIVFARRDGPWHPTSTAPFTPYEAHAVGLSLLLEGDSISHKGALRVELAGPLGSLCLVVTHLQSQYPEKGLDHLYVNERRAQMDELRKVEQECKSLPTLVVGDFNTSPGEQELYDDHIKLLGEDLTVRTRDECDHGCGSHFTADHAKWEWIDYILSPTPGVRPEVARITNTGEDRPYSDHDGLLVRFRFGHASR